MMMMVGEVTHYKLAYVHKSGGRMPLPPLPDPPIFERGDLFRRFFLSKVRFFWQRLTRGVGTSDSGSGSG